MLFLMRYPPALSFALRASRLHRCVAVLFATILVANYALVLCGNSYFSYKNGLCFMLSAVAVSWLLRDAWKLPQGSLRYSQGQWSWLHQDQEIAGTCALHIDLQSYMLVSFRSDSAQDQLFQTRSQWFHLEARHADHAALSVSPSAGVGWLALRRALYCPKGPVDEAVAA
jgi:hypothetical protein